MRLTFTVTTWWQGLALGIVATVYVIGVYFACGLVHRWATYLLGLLVLRRDIPSHVMDEWVEEFNDQQGRDMR